MQVPRNARSRLFSRICSSVIGEVPYYYVVELPASDTGEETVGYVYKGNLTIKELEIPEKATEAQKKVSE